MATAAISAQEQLMIELLNRARLDPLGEAARYNISLNEGLTAGTISATPKAPLAFDVDLNESAAAHSSWMLANDTFSHTGSGRSSPHARMEAAGYKFAGSWKSGENISWKGTTGSVDSTQAIYEQHKSLFLSEGHRVNILGDFREVGIAQEFGGFSTGGTAYNSSMITQNFAKTGTEAFITGVAYTDSDGDRFYDVGEGKAGIIVDWLGNTGGAVSSAAAGGYGVIIPTGLTGTAAVSIDVGTVTMRATLGMTGTSVKLDVIDGRVLASSVDLALGTNAKDALLLGVANTDLTGNSGANVLTGNKGANVLTGMGGGDTLKGGAGADDFVFRVSADSAPSARDVIADFAKGSDDVVLSNVDASTATTGNQAFALDTNSSFSAGEVRQSVSTSGLLLEFNTDSDSTAEMSVLLRNLTSPLAATDFLL